MDHNWESSIIKELPTIRKSPIDLLSMDWPMLNISLWIESSPNKRHSELHLDDDQKPLKKQCLRHEPSNSSILPLISSSYVASQHIKQHSPDNHNYSSISPTHPDATGNSSTFFDNFLSLTAANALLQNQPNNYLPATTPYSSSSSSSSSSSNTSNQSPYPPTFIQQEKQSKEDQAEQPSSLSLKKIIPSSKNKKMSTNTPRKLHLCNHPGCDYSTYNSTNFTIQKCTHTGEKPYQCTHANCSSKFANKSNLKRHELTHKEERPYACEYPGCNKKFIQKETLKNHSRIHTGETPFECNYCDYQSSQKANLSVHIKKKHPSAQ